jgi:hypothetical protein
MQLPLDRAARRVPADREGGLMDSGAPGIGDRELAHLRHCPQPIALHEAPFGDLYLVGSDRRINPWEETLSVRNII